MLKRIEVRDARVGMYLHRIEGRWLRHPFWRSRFLIGEPGELHRLQACGIRHVWIDTDRGADLDLEPASPSPSPSPGIQSLETGQSAPPVEPSRRSVLDEGAAAAKTCLRACQVLQVVFEDARLGKAVALQHSRELVFEVCESVLRNQAAMPAIARLRNADNYTYMHSVAVCALMVATARQLGMSEGECLDAGVAGLLHDVGKALIPTDILNKPGALTETELSVMRTHPARGCELLASSAAPDIAIDVCLSHHEQPSGKGYPNALTGDRLTQFAKMCTICDVYDAITSARPYKTAWDPAESISRMACSKGQFDEAILEAFIRCVGIYPIGSLVKLASNRLAIVVEINPRKLAAPIVKTFYSLGSNIGTAPETLDLSAASDWIVGREDPSAWKGHNLDSLWFDPESLRRSGWPGMASLASVPRAAPPACLYR